MAEKVKKSAHLSENLPPKALVERRSAIVGDGLQVIRAFCGIHHPGECRDFLLGKDVQK
jgi:hypothetical protein